MMRNTLKALRKWLKALLLYPSQTYDFNIYMDVTSNNPGGMIQTAEVNKRTNE